MMRGLLFCCSLALLAVAPALASTPKSLGSSKNWSAYENGKGADKVCYALASPQSSDPASAHRGQIYFLISDFPARKVKAQPEFVPGYDYKKGGDEISVEIAQDKFDFFTKNDGGSGSAWLKDEKDGGRLIAAMKSGQQAVVTGTSAHGTLTRDSFSLDGLSAALVRAHKACGM